MAIIFEYELRRGTGRRSGLDKDNGFRENDVKEMCCKQHEQFTLSLATEPHTNFELRVSSFGLN